MAGGRKLAEVFYEIRAKTDGLKRDLDESERSFGKLTKFIRDNPVAAVGGVATALLGVAVSAAKMAADVDASMRKVVNSTNAGAASINGLKETVASLSKETGKGQDGLAQAAALAAKDSQTAEEAGVRLSAALKLSVVSGEDLASTIGSLDQVLDLFNISADDAEKAVAEIFAASKGGAGSTSDIFAALEKAAPTLAKLKIDLPTAARALAQLGEQGLKGKKLIGEFEAIANAGEAGRKEIERLAESAPKAANAVGELDAAFTKVNDSGANAGNRLRSAFEAFTIELGNKTLPLLESLVTILDNLNGTIGKIEGGASLATVLSIGDEAAKATAFTETFTRARDAALDLSAQVRKGAVDLNSLSNELLAQLATNTAALISNAQLTAGQRSQYQLLLATILQVEEARGRALKPLPADPNAGKTAPLFSATHLSQDEIDKAAEAAKVASAAFRDLTQSADDLFAKARLGDVTLAEFDRGVRELADGFSKVKKPTDAMRAAFEAVISQADHVRESLVKIKADAVTAEFNKLRNSLLPESLRDFNVVLIAMRKELAEKGITGARAEELIKLATVAEESEKALTALDKRLGVIGEAGLPPLKELILLSRELLDLQREEEALIGQRGTDVDAKRLAIHAQMLKVEQAQAAVAAKHEGSLTKASVKAFTLAKGFSDAADAAFGISTALLGADHNITKLLGGLSQVAGGFDKIGEIAKKPGGLGAALGSASGIASLLPGIGSIVGGVGALATTLAPLLGGDPHAAERALEHKENLAALKQIEKHTGDLVDINASGATINKVTAGVNQLLALTGDAGGFRKFGSGPLRGINEANVLQASTGLPFKEIEALAKSLGITLNGTKQSYLDFALALKTLDFKAFNDSFEGQLEELNTEFELFPERFKTNADRFTAIVNLLNDATVGAPELFKGLQGIDVSSIDGSARALAKIQELFERLKRGELTAAELNGLSLSEFLEQLKSLKAQLEQSGLTSAADTFSQALEAFGVAVELGSLTAEEKLTRAKDLFGQLFPELAAAVDTSSIETFKNSIKSIVDGFAADGILTDAEKKQIEVLRALAAAFDTSAAGGKQLVDALAVLEDQFAIFGTDALGRFAGLGKALGEQFPDISSLLEGIDISTGTGRADLQKRAQELFAKLAEGGVTADEQKVIDAIKRLLQAAGAVASEEATAQEAKLRAEADKRRAILAQAEAEIRANDVTDPTEQLRIRLAALTKAFPGLSEAIGNIDVTTAKGRAALEAFVKDLVASPEKLAELAASLGISVDELLASLLGLEDGADAAATHVATLAEKLQTAFAEIDFSLALEGVTDPIEKLKRTAGAVGAALPALNKALAGLDFSTEAGRKAAELALIGLGKGTTDPAVRDAILNLLGQIRAIPGAEAPTTPVDTSNAGAERSQTFDGSVQITAIQADRLLDLARTQATYLRQIVENTAGFKALFVPINPALLLRPVALSGAQGGATQGPGGVTIRITQTNNFDTNALPQAQAAQKDITEALLRGIDEGLAILQARDRLAGGDTAR